MPVPVLELPAECLQISQQERFMHGFGTFGQQTTSKNLQECDEQEIAAILMTKQDSSSGGCVKHAKFVKFNSWSSWPHSGVYLLCLLQQTRVAEKLLKALPAQKAAKWCDVGSAKWERKDQCLKSSKKKTASIYDSTSDSCVRFSWHFEPYWKAGSRFKYSQVGEPELCRFFESGSEQMKVHIPVLWSGFLPFYAWQSHVPRLSPFAFVNSLNLIHHEVCWQNWAIESIEKTQMDPNSISYNQKGPNQDCVFAMRALPEDQAARECD